MTPPAVTAAGPLARLLVAIRDATRWQQTDGVLVERNSWAEIVDAALEVQAMPRDYDPMTCPITPGDRRDGYAC